MCLWLCPVSRGASAISAVMSLAHATVIILLVTPTSASNLGPVTVYTTVECLPLRFVFFRLPGFRRRNSSGYVVDGSTFLSSARKLKPKASAFDSDTL